MSTSPPLKISAQAHLPKRAIPLTFMYAALTNIKYSNHEISQINYNKPGFMEDNTVHREKSAKLISASKKLSRRHKESKGRARPGRNASVRHDLYSCSCWQMKLGRIRAQRTALDLLDAHQDGNIRLQVRTDGIQRQNGEIRQRAEALLRTLMKKESFSVNAFYYTALALFKTGLAQVIETVLLEAIEAAIEERER